MPVRTEGRPGRRLRRRSDIDAARAGPGGQRLDALVTTAGHAAESGYPSATAPAARAGALPIGLSLIGASGDDSQLLGVAAEVATNLHARIPPAIPPALVSVTG